MAKLVTHQKSFNFTAGLSTEAGFLTFPENAWQEGTNVVPKINGELHKRVAVDLEASYELSPQKGAEVKEPLAFTLGEWNCVGGNGGRNFLVAQLGDIVYFYDNFGVAISPTRKSFVVPLALYKVANSPEATGYYPISCSSGNGDLLICSANTEPLLIQYRDDVDNLTITPLTINIRDFVGVDDGLAVDERPTTLTMEHLYNLRNQGWSVTQYAAYKTATTKYPSNAQTWTTGKNSTDDFTPSLLDKQDFGTSPAPKGRFVLNAFDVQRGAFLSTVEGGGGVATTVTTDHGTLPTDGVYPNVSPYYHPDHAAGVGFGLVATITVSSLAVAITAIAEGGIDYKVGEILTYPVMNALGILTYPKFLITTVTPNNTLVAESIPELYRPTTTAFFAGRAWYAGIQSKSMNTWVMFSQVAETKTNYGNCYQSADPTSEIISDLVDTDGGVIPIPDAGTIIKLVALANSMLVFADNGVWHIASPDGGFSATGYRVNKITNVGCINANSVVEVNNSILYFSTNGIYLISLDGVSQTFISQPLTDLTIKSTYLSIPLFGKLFAHGVFHEEDQLIYWFYNNSATQDGVTDRYKKDSALVFDVRLKAFYTLSFSSLVSNSPFFVAGAVTKGRGLSDNAMNVVVGADQVVVGADDVVAGSVFSAGRNKTLKLLTCTQGGATSWNYTFSDMDVAVLRNTPYRFRDWYTWDSVGVSFPAYILTGASLMGDNADKMKQPLYITMFMRKTETGFDTNFNVLNPSSCLLQARWDWTNLALPGKWSPEREVYRHTRMMVIDDIADTPSEGYPLIVTKNKVRGEGRALALKFTADPDKDMKIVGWEITYVGNSNV